MSSTYTGDASHITIGTPAAITQPADGDPASAASVNSPGPFEYITDFLAYLQTYAGLLNRAGTWTTKQTFNVGLDIHGPVNLLGTSGSDFLSVAGNAEIGGTLQVDSASLFQAAATFAAGIARGAAVVPTLNAGAFSSSGTQKLGYWIDVQGVMHVEGLVVSLAGTPTKVWAAGVMPAAYRPPTGNTRQSSVFATNASKVGIAEVYDDGSLNLINTDGSACGSAWVNFSLLPNSVVTYVP